MKLYLMRHGHAEENYSDDLRPLSEYGRIEATSAAETAVAIHGLAVDEIYHSPKLRARQTAEILSESLDHKLDIKEGLEMLPLDDPVYCRNQVQESEKDMALVGHMPFMADLAMLLLHDSNDPRVVRFPTAQIVHLIRAENGLWKWGWTVGP